VLLVVAVALAAWVALDLRQAYASLRSAESDAGRAQTALLDGDMATAATRFASAQESFEAAHTRMNRPAVRLVGIIPLAGRNLGVVRALSESGALVAAAGHTISAAVEELPGGPAGARPTGRPAAGGPHGGARPGPARRRRAIDAADARMAEAPDTWLAGPVAQARTDFAARLDAVVEPARAGAALADALPAFLGAEGPRTYFFGAQNPAELRGTGGLIGAWAVLTVRDGQLEFGDFETIGTLTLRGRGSADPAAAERGVRGALHPLRRRRSRVEHQHDPGLPHRGAGDREPLRAPPRRAPRRGHRRRPLHVRGAAAGDGTGRRPRGPSHRRRHRRRLRHPRPVRGLRRDRPRPQARHGRGREGRPRAVPRRRRRRPRAQLPVLGEVAGAGHLLLHSQHADEQQAFTAARVAGAFPADPEGALFAVITNNAGANKLDSYLEQELDYELWLAADGSARGRARIRFTNTAPTSGAHQTVLGPNFDGVSEPGENLLYVSVYCAPDCGLLGVTRDGAVSTIGVESELGAVVFPTSVRLPSGAQDEIVLDWQQRDAWDGETFRLTVPEQPLMRPPARTITVHPPVDWALSTRHAPPAGEDAAVRLATDERARIELELHARPASSWWERVLRERAG
jgi:hypothetical protein